MEDFESLQGGGLAATPTANHRNIDSGSRSTAVAPLPRPPPFPAACCLAGKQTAPICLSSPPKSPRRACLPVPLPRQMGPAVRGASALTRIVWVPTTSFSFSVLPSASLKGPCSGSQNLTVLSLPALARILPSVENATCSIEGGGLGRAVLPTQWREAAHRFDHLVVGEGLPVVDNQLPLLNITA